MSQPDDAPAGAPSDPLPAAPDGEPPAASGGTPVPEAFAALGLDPRLLQVLGDLGYEEPTPVQRAAIPPLLAGRDLLAEAPTGTGKTAAFALPLLQALAAVRPLPGAGASGADDAAGEAPAPRPGRGGAGRPTALVLAPTRELAVQVAEAVFRYGRRVGARVVPVYGGQPIAAQLHRLARGVDVVVATPGRAVDHLERGTLVLDDVRRVVLDEADEMLDMGFAEDLERILGAVPEGRQTALFSATISGPIAALAARQLRDPERVRVTAAPVATGEAPAVRQVAYVVRRPDKLAALGRILDLEDGAATLVFARTRGEVEDLAAALSGRGHDAAALHGGLAQETRDRVLARFRDGSLDVLVATDVAARGLDIDLVTHVVNFDVPSSAETYVHRVGRTGRAGRAGTAITLVEPREHRLLREIERTLGRPLELAGLPTVADVREHRWDLLRATLRETLVGDDLDRYRAVLEPLAAEFDPVDVALAAIALHDAAGRGPEDEVELAPAFLPELAGRRFGQGGGRAPRGAPPGARDRSADGRPPFRPGPRPPDGPWQAPGPGMRGPEGPWQRPEPGPGRPGDAGDAPRPHPEGPWQAPGRPRDVPVHAGPERPAWQRRPGPPGPERPARPGPGVPREIHRGPQGVPPPGWREAGRPGGPPGRGPGSGIARLFFGVGRTAGIRPGDLVGAIANEAGLSGRDIGAIQIAETYSVVEVPEAAVGRVLGAMREATIRGRSVTVRRERD